MFAVSTELVQALLLAIIVSILAPMIATLTKEHLAKKGRLAREEEAKAERAKELEQARLDREQARADRLAERQQEWDRQDELARRAERTAEFLARQQVNIAGQAAEDSRLLRETLENRAVKVADVLEETNAIANSQIRDLKTTSEKTHALVDSSMTASLQAHLDSGRALLSTLKHNAQLEEPDQDLKDLMAATEAKIGKLEKEIAKRERGGEDEDLGG